MNPFEQRRHSEIDRRNFLSMVGKGVGLAALTTASIDALLTDVRAAAKRIEHFTPDQAAADEDYWFEIQNAFRSEMFDAFGCGTNIGEERIDGRCRECG